MYQCPECDEPFATLEGVAMHVVNKPDDNHSGYDSKYAVKKAVDSPAQSDQEQAVSDGGSKQTVETAHTETGHTERKDSSEYDLPEFDHGGDLDGVQTHSFECCDSPSVTGSTGDMFRLDSGQVVQLEEGEQICINCDTIHNGGGD